ncbi:thiamine-triphosphatase isoform X2 [Podarcis raffonei]|uniref:thiamine-triphosphatase isoform X2 n=1 Tax=Podarcis raffonei TaxID=65483 RepID=UPI002329035F|nr:thiamine-triphosphatase isoform X2 [Podarcis raffonei]
MEGGSRRAAKAPARRPAGRGGETTTPRRLCATHQQPASASLPLFLFLHFAFFSLSVHSSGRRSSLPGVDMASGSDGGEEAAAESPDSPVGKDSASGSIEVEQKFLFGPDAVQKLEALGAMPEASVSFRDRYYDIPDWRLTLADHWLRQREGAGWELKFPLRPLEGAATSQGQQNLPEPPAGARSHEPQHPLQPPEGAGRTHLATQYQEVTCPRDIVARVCGLLGVDPAAGWQSNVARAVEELGLQEFASFVTRRCKYRLASLHLTVDLDEMDFGYAVGEVEAMVLREQEVPEALERIQELGSRLGLDMKSPIPGKMSVYLLKFRPSHYEALMRARSLRKVRAATDEEGN